MSKRAMDLKVFTTTEASCSECGEDLGRGAWITLVEDKGALCLSCADLDHLVFLPAGDAALTRRARKRYERQGLLVEAKALEQAEEECLNDSEARARRREREAERREELDRQYVEPFAARIGQHFPRCPPELETTIAEHACLRYSGRVGRSAAAKSLDANAVQLEVIAHIRHNETEHDSLLASGYDRYEERMEVADAVVRVLTQWKPPE